jgi:hypothetical protein
VSPLTGFGKPAIMCRGQKNQPALLPLEIFSDGELVLQDQYLHDGIETVQLANYKHCFPVVDVQSVQIRGLSAINQAILARYVHPGHHKSERPFSDRADHALPLKRNPYFPHLPFWGIMCKFVATK